MTSVVPHIFLCWMSPTYENDRIDNILLNYIKYGLPSIISFYSNMDKFQPQYE